MVLAAARTINLVAAGLLAGNELGSKLTAHPALAELPPRTHVEAEQALTRRYGRVMPVFMTATLATYLPVLALEPRRASRRSLLALAGLGCHGAMLAITLTRNLPINERLLALDAGAAPYEEFQELRARWERLHTVRNVLNVTALTVTALGVTTSP